MSRKIDSIKSEIDEGLTLMAELEVLLEHHFFGTAVHTIYYGCFRITRALLLTKDIVAKTHKGIATLLFEHFVQPGIVEKEKASFFSKLLAKRMESDYEKLVMSADEVYLIVDQAEEYFHYIKALVDNYLDENSDHQIG